MLLLFCFVYGICLKARVRLRHTRQMRETFRKQDGRDRIICVRICGGSARRRIGERRRSLRFAAPPRSEVFGRRERRIGACESKRLTNAFGFAYNVNEKHIRQEYPAGNGQREGSAAESPLRGMREKCGRTAPRRKCRGGRRRYTHTRGGLLSAIKVGPR